MQTESEIRASVEEYYGKTVQQSTDLKTNACCCSPPPEYVKKLLKQVPDVIKNKFYGCGSPIPSDIQDLTILDLGSGSGRDCYVAAALAGPKGKIIGLDMTDEQLEIAREFADDFCTDMLNYPNPTMEYKKGFIETIKESTGLPDNSVDLVMSNCVINLSPNKPAVLKGAFDVLNQGGELYFSDVYCDRRLSKEVKENKVLWGECLSGALYLRDFQRISREVGFAHTRILKCEPLIVNNGELAKVLGDAKFWSIDFRCFKLDELEETEENYGQTATYNGGIEGSETKYTLDVDFKFTKGESTPVSGNVASILTKTRLAKFFTVTGDKSNHLGAFNELQGVSCCAPASSCCPPSGGGCC